MTFKGPHRGGLSICVMKQETSDSVQVFLFPRIRVREGQLRYRIPI